MTKSSPLFTPVLIAGCLIIMISFAIRASFGVFQIPIAEELGWMRAEFSLAIAIQNLAWGFGQPIFGAISEKMGDRKAIFFGAILYALGLVASSAAVTPGAMQAYEVLVGFGIAGTGFGVILAVVGRAATDEHRAMAMAIATAAGSAGQVIGAPLAEWLLGVMSWQGGVLTFAALILAVLLTLPMMRAPEAAKQVEAAEKMSVILARAFRDPSYTMIFLGFFSCGYQLGFMTAHFPAFVTEICGPILAGSLLHTVGITTTSALGAVAISLIGLSNIGGTILAGWLSNRFAKKNLLALIYALRTVISCVFILVPMTPETVLLFAVSMGALWLATVPLTSGLVAHLYGLQYMGTLYGIVFFSHQVGSFLGVWLGGRMYDTYGTYDAVWWVGVGVGAFSALIHLPVRENRQAPVAA
jgi:MFS family permease